jgi:large subunit ribosomal protein L15
MPHKLRKTRNKSGWSWVQRYDPNYFGKDGFTSPKSLRQKVNVINVGKLDEMSERISVEKEKGQFLVDLANLGFTKLLGTGKITKPLTVRVASCSKSAAEKIKEAGGQILMEAQEEGE